LSQKIKPIAIHLPQFHPFQENDEWWGKGFTEWTNVTSAKPNFKGHYQPHLPADLGFYDLRLEEARMAQIALAQAYGIYGFCYYHYWFNGKRLMEQPLDRMLANKEENFPFMLCWANENWTRRWDGHDHEVLIKQNYSDGDDLKHIRFLCETFFKDERYIKVDGKPIYLIYRPQLFPNIEKTISLWRKEAIKMGIGELYIGFMQNAQFNFDPQTVGFDFAVDFQPNFASIYSQKKIILKEKIEKKLASKFNIKIPASFSHTIIDYRKFSISQQKNDFRKNVYPSITPMWDNSSRRKRNALILKNSTPTAYGDWLKHIRDNYSWNNMPESFLFINAWNEWAEGNHLEPCGRWGKKYLETTKSCVGYFGNL
jgi:hypothetical protein